jgi:membrane-associated phospholipid phosphatase
MDEGRADAEPGEAAAEPGAEGLTPEQLALLAEGCTRSGVVWLRPDGEEMSPHDWQNPWIASLAFAVGGDALPVAALGLSAVFAFDESRPGLSDAGVAALEAGGAAFFLSTGLKYAVGRARPDSGRGMSDFHPGAREDDWHSFPSRHTMLMWAAVTPYAEEYGMPWLYGLAALTNAARVASHEHWVSDTVASSLLGLAAGHLAWQGRRDSRAGKTGPRLTLAPTGVGVAWDY